MSAGLLCRWTISLFDDDDDDVVRMYEIIGNNFNDVIHRLGSSIPAKKEAPTAMRLM